MSHSSHLSVDAVSFHDALRRPIRWRRLIIMSSLSVCCVLGLCASYSASLADAVATRRLSALLDVASPNTSEHGDNCTHADLLPDQVLPWLRAQAFNQRTERALQNHPLVAAADAGTMPLEVVKLILSEEYSIEKSDLRSMAAALARHGDAPASRDFIQQSVDSEAVALQKLVAMAQVFVLSEEALSAYEPMPIAHAYSAYLAQLSNYGGAAAIAAGFAVNFPAYGQMCGRIRDALVAQYGYSQEDVSFLSWFAEPIPGYDDLAEKVISEGMLRGEQLCEIKESVRLLQGYEILFWDAVWAKSQDSHAMFAPLQV